MGGEGLGSFRKEATGCQVRELAGEERTSSVVMGVWFFSRSLATVLESERRSSFVLRSEVVSSEQ